jgi:hypothetical protein
MRIMAVFAILLVGICSIGNAASAATADKCKACLDQQRACMSNYAGPTCKTEYDRCMNSCRGK